ncbi:hypothetical protein NKG94_10380 [Micromonospora sp. M12]
MIPRRSPHCSRTGSSPWPRGSPDRRPPAQWRLHQGVVSPLAMQVAGTPTFLRTADEQGVSPELLSPYFALMRRRLAEGNGAEDLTGVIDLLAR